ncbi:hypothetical protein LEP1GSC163_3509 [Leptospira santarosai str. CBC379]|nr:hypothetical protein LEP1GSC163_3509 [Leptospira santarosai str. CBC379]
MFNMRLAYPIQKFQDWFTQQWVIFRGERIEPETVPWLIGPFGKLGSIADDFVNQLAEEEDLIIERNSISTGLLPSIQELKLSDSARLSRNIIDFYENTTLYKLKLSVKWHPLFKIFGNLVINLFSNRIQQLNIPTNNLERLNQINSEIITLKEPKSGDVKYTIWYRTFESTGYVLYSGVYTTCMLPSGKICIKAVFPLPKGNATVIMSPSVGPNGELCLDASGKKFGDPGFYFLVNDSRGDVWSQYIRSFRDRLNVYCYDGKIFAEQTLTLWRQCILRFKYEIHRNK